MEIEEPSRLDAFRQEARTWLNANFPPALAGSTVEIQYSGTPESPEAQAWRRRVGEKGWGAPTWPTAYGGGGLSGAEARVLKEEMARIGAYNPVYISLGLTMVGPTLLDYGAAEQKARHLPGIARGETIWCLGYSEPGAGSDLASLQTRCEPDGDRFIINGSKIWTSGANHADWCGVLVRTDPSAPRHEGISFVMMEMRQPGIETRPIEMIGGASSFCEMFFTDAIAQSDDLLGPLNGGWTVGKRLLQHERASQTGDSIASPSGPSLPDIARGYLPFDETGRLADSDLRARLTGLLMHERAHALTLARAHAETRGSTNPSNAVSMLKASSTRAAQQRAELVVEIMGAQGLGWSGPGFEDDELAAVRSWLSGKAISIAGGSYEIQLNIIAKRILGLPT